jgi:hypothetical protein
MKKALVYLLVVFSLTFTSCIGPQGMSGDTGYSAEAEVFELRNINFDTMPQMATPFTAVSTRIFMPRIIF